MSYPNQQKIVIHKTKLGNQYTSINTECLSKALQKLTAGTEIKMYLYLCGNKDGYEKDFSKVAFKNFSGSSNYKDTKKKLIDKGFIVEDSKGRLHFYEDGNPPNEVEEVDLSQSAVGVNPPIEEKDVNPFQDTVDVNPPPYVNDKFGFVF